MCRVSSTCVRPCAVTRNYSAVLDRLWESTCLRACCAPWFDQRIHLDIRVGEQSNDYETIQKKEQLSQVETRLYQLLAQVRQIANEQSYQRVSGRVRMGCCAPACLPGGKAPTFRLLPGVQR